MALEPADMQDKTALLSVETRTRIDGWVAKFPSEHKRSALIQALVAVQDQNGGWLNIELTEAVAAYLDLPPVWAFEVASFYSMFVTEKVGRHCVSVCTNVSCMITGADEIVRYIERKYGIETGESTPDGKIFLKKEEECLAACTGAPMMMVNHRFYENLTPEKVDEILDALE